MTPDDIVMMTCDWCGKEFPADARACVESGFSAYHPPEDGEEWKGEEAVALQPGEFALQDREAMKREMCLTDEQLDELLSTGTVDSGGAIVCLECQDSGIQLPIPD